MTPKTVIQWLALSRGGRHGLKPQVVRFPDLPGQLAWIKLLVLIMKK